MVDDAEAERARRHHPRRFDAAPVVVEDNRAGTRWRYWNKSGPLGITNVQVRCSRAGRVADMFRVRPERGLRDVAGSHAAQGSGSRGQSSTRSHTPSPSVSVARHVGGAARARAAALLGGIADARRGRQMVAAGWKASGGQATEEPSQVSAKVAHARRRAADGARGLSRVGGAVVVHPVAALGYVAHPRRRAAHRRALGVGRARGARPVAGLGQVADARRRPAFDGRGLEGVGRAVVARPVAALRHVARPRAGRHTAVLFPSADSRRRAGAGLAASQAPAAARHSTVAGWKVSAGQSLLTPSQALGHVAYTRRRAAHGRCSSRPRDSRRSSPCRSRSGRTRPPPRGTPCPRHQDIGRAVVHAPVAGLATSHTPAAARHSAVLFASGGHSG